MNFNDPLVDSGNPYASPTGNSSLTLSGVSTRGMVGQVQILGVLMIIQGIFVTLAALGLAAYAIFMPQVLQQAQQQGGANPPPFPPNAPFWFAVGFGVLSAVLFVIGLMTVYAGFRTFHFQSRVFAIVTLCIGMLTLFTCYCLPTQLGLLVYGLVTLLNAQVSAAYGLRANGNSVRDIQRAFMSLP